MPLFAATAVVGALMPVLPRATMPLIFQQHHYVDRVTSISDAVGWWPLCVWSSLPFALLALVGILRRANANARTGALLAIFVTLLLGWFCNIPQDTPGVNFASAFFPFYAGVVSTATYLVAYAALRLIRGAA